MNKKFHQYDVVRVIGFGPEADLTPSEFDKRTPQIGDTATIIEVYNNPPGFELECCEESLTGETTWLRAFGENEIKFELLKSQNSCGDKKS